MRLFKSLDNELHTPVKGTWAPYYFRFLGYNEDLCAPAPILRARGIYTLFTETEPVVFPSELVLGNKMCLATEKADPVRLKYARAKVDEFGLRTFAKNNDHFAPDYRHLLAVGVPGLIEEIDRSSKVHADDPGRLLTLEAMRLTLVGFTEMIENYADKAESLIGTNGYCDDRLASAAKTCRAVAHGKPETFREALQLVWFCHNSFQLESRYAMALGRLDQYLYPFYKADRDAGRLTPDEAGELLENVFIRLRGDVVNICVGGTSPDGSCDVNELSYIIVRAVRTCFIPGPNLSARISENTPDSFLDECLCSIGTGLGYPALMNDRVNLDALRKYGYEDSDLYDYCMVGCIENFISGKQPPWSDNRFDTPRFFDFVFNDGVSEISETAGVTTPALSELTTMDEFMRAFEKQVSYGVTEYCARLNNYNNSINQSHYPEPFLSCFCCDCIGRGLDINCGGAKYPSVHGAALMGVGTVADSLAAIEKVVYVDKAATLEELRNAMKANYEGYGELREKLLAAPKYGNNDDFVDKYAVWFVDFIPNEFNKYKTRDGGGVYIGMASNTQNISAGEITGATPDGRLAREPLSDAASPTYGRDTHGATATVLSISKPDYTNSALGSVINQKYSPAMFKDEKRAKLLSLIRTYFRLGGQEIQINATSPEVLRDAMDNPENYRDLVVRVSGFSAYYTELGRKVQEDILNRTQKDE